MSLLRVKQKFIVYLLLTAWSYYMFIVSLLQNCYRVYYKFIVSLLKVYYEFIFPQIINFQLKIKSNKNKDKNYF